MRVLIVEEHMPGWEGLHWQELKTRGGQGPGPAEANFYRRARRLIGSLASRTPGSGSARVRRGLIRTDFWVIIGLPNAHIVNPFGYYFVKGRKFSQGRKKCANYEEYNDLSDFSPSEGKAFGVNSRHCSTMWKSGSYSHHSVM